MMENRETRAPSRCAAARLAIVLAVALAAAAPPAPAAPLSAKGPYGSTVDLELSNRLRGEFVDWFAPDPNGPTPTFRYDFLANKLQLGARLRRQGFEVFVQLQNTTIALLPDDGVGVGSVYYANTRRELQNGVFLRNAWFAAEAPFGLGGFSIRAGRMLYSDALDAPAATPDLQWLQVNRMSQRLIGPFDYTHVGRSFDGGTLAYDTELLNLTGFGFVPTFGGFEVDANRELDVTVLGGALNLKESPAVGPTIARLFWYYYEDDRDLVFVDNRPLADRQTDLGKGSAIFTVGASVIRLEPLGPGVADGVAYGFGQFGEWQSLSHRAWAYGVESGYRLTGVWAKPWLRTGINSGSGDTNPNDDRHGTFFQMLPTAWPYARFPFYNMMNSQDVFAQTIVDPHPRFGLQLDFHWLRLNSSRDLAYFGGGATSNDFFGFGGVDGNGRSEVAYLAHAMLTLRATAFLSFNALYARAWGQGVIDQTFAGRNGNYAFIEALLAF